MTVDEALREVSSRGLRVNQAQEDPDGYWRVFVCGPQQAPWAWCGGKTLADALAFALDKLKAPPPNSDFLS